MKKYFFLLLALSAVILGCSNNPVNSSKEQSIQPVAAVASGCTQSAAMKAWEALSQATRDQKILSLATWEMGGYNTYNSGQCWGWVYHVVSVASGCAVFIPLYDPNNMSMWQSAPCMPIQGRCTMIENCIPMDIIQMYWNVRMAGGTYKVTQHTAFFLNGNVTSNGVKGFFMLDCNFVPAPSGPKDNYIGIHFVSYSDFYSFTRPTTANPKLGYNVYHVQ
ncbi:MAG TPA: hypothetical protein VMC41_00970 [Candidatus Nanoarchaeia archaeon]|nr:hypothetical protein [Candidatus Nanoarchaeia archaeon]